MPISSCRFRSQLSSLTPGYGKPFYLQQYIWLLLRSSSSCCGRVCDLYWILWCVFMCANACLLAWTCFYAFAWRECHSREYLHIQPLLFVLCHECPTSNKLHSNHKACASRCSGRYKYISFVWRRIDLCVSRSSSVYVQNVVMNTKMNNVVMHTTCNSADNNKLTIFK